MIAFGFLLVAEREECIALNDKQLALQTAVFHNVQPFRGGLAGLIVKTLTEFGLGFDVVALGLAGTIGSDVDEVVHRLHGVLIVAHFEKRLAQVVPDRSLGVLRSVRRGRPSQVAGCTVEVLLVEERQPQITQHPWHQHGIGILGAIVIDLLRERIDIALAPKAEQNLLRPRVAVGLLIQPHSIAELRQRLRRILQLDVAHSYFVSRFGAGSAGWELLH